MSQIHKIAVLRCDRLGDVLLSLPTLSLIKASAPNCELTFVCRKDHHLVLEPLAAQMGFALQTPESFSFRKQGYHAALFLQAEKECYLDALRSGVKHRVGLKSKWYAFLSLTDGIRQRRSFATQNEAQYNLELGRLLLQRLSIADVPVPLVTLPENEGAAMTARERLAKLGISSPEPFAIVHPGMGGSALNIPLDRWKEILVATTEKIPLVCTFGPAPRDQKLRNELSAIVSNLKIVDDVNLAVLAEIFRMAQFVVAPSTGPIHLAHFVGTKTYGLYSPVRTHRATRWAPYGNGAATYTHEPAVQCPAKLECLGERCRFFPCMQRTDWNLWLEGQISTA